MMKRRNEKKVFLIEVLLLFFFIFSIFFVIKNTMSRYSNDVKAVGSLSTAMYIVEEGYQSMNLNLGSLAPRNNPYEYNFSVSNFDENNRTEVNLEYDLKLVATTNLPLTYELYINGGSENIIKTDTIDRDEYQTYFRTMTTETKRFGFTKDEINTYKLVVHFPETYKDIKYQDVIEGIEIQINSKQIID